MHLKRSAATVATLAAAAFAATPALADVQVTLNGNTLQLSPPPITRAGRVFVPLRAIFESLGASVVYQGGVINATKGGRAISLTIGSTQASVGGQSQALDVAPFIVGASTFVPLRFVSQALGASVNYDGQNQIVAITNQGDSGMRGRDTDRRPPVAQQPPPQSDDITDVAPGRDQTIGATRPAIHARFTQPVDTGSVHVFLDDRDVSNEAYLNPTALNFTPPYDLPAGRHEVRITGQAQGGGSFERRWTFAVGNVASAPRSNFLNDLAPADGAQVGQNFRIRGTTLPNAKVHIVARGAGATLGGIFRISDGNTYTTDVQADAEGRFGAEVTLPGPGGSVIVALQSVSPDGQAISRRLQLQSGR
jgi:hypothetical protein